jgi:hypothetical protein
MQRIEAFGGAFPAGAGFFGQDDSDDDEATAEEASRQAGSSGDTNLFGGILGALGQKKSEIVKEDVDEEGRQSIKASRVY